MINEQRCGYEPKKRSELLIELEVAAAHLVAHLGSRVSSVSISCLTCVQLMLYAVMQPPLPPRRLEVARLRLYLARHSTSFDPRVVVSAAAQLEHEFRRIQPRDSPPTLRPPCRLSLSGQHSDVSAHISIPPAATTMTAMKTIQRTVAVTPLPSLHVERADDDTRCGVCASAAADGLWPNVARANIFSSALYGDADSDDGDANVHARLLVGALSLYCDVSGHCLLAVSSSSVAP